MAKKRVYELAKELGLTNKQLVDKLHEMGFDVRSHSSSLEDVEADAVLQRLKGPAEPEAPKPTAFTGGVVRRRRRVADGETEVVTETRIVPGQHAADEEVLSTREQPVEPEPEPEVVETPAAEEPAETWAEDYEEVPAYEAEQEEAPEAPLPATEPPQVEAPEAPRAAAPESETSAAQAEEAAQPVPPRPQPAPEAAQPPAAPAARPTPPQREAPRPHAEARPSGPQRPAQRRDLPPVEEGAVTNIENRLKEPTATQAVVISRPRVPVAPKVPPAPRGAPGAAGPGRRIGPVKEYQVVSDGRGRELVDVTKDKTGAKKKAPPGGARRGPKEGFSRNELMTMARERAYIPMRGRKKRPTKKGKRTEVTQTAAHKRIIRIEESIQVAELAKQMGVRLVDVIRKLMQMGAPATANQFIDVDTAALVAEDFEYTVEKVGLELEDLIETAEIDESALSQRPPVVTVMGHVDHGKTSILDYVRKAHVAAGEAGGITQHIGAYSVPVGEGSVTFLDTPGHEAFTAMRARGAQVTDIVILVVAADDSIMPQTIEAINHAKASKVPIVVAVNKCDLPQANPERVRQGLTEHGLIPEEWGGDTMVVNVSAKTGDNIDKLLESVLLQAEVLELRANPDQSAEGVVVEARLEKGRGPVATCLVKNGTLHRGDVIFTGTQYGKIRVLIDDRGNTVQEIGPGYPAEVLGLSGLPAAGDKWWIVKDEKAARDLAEKNIDKQRATSLAGDAAVSKKASLEELFSKMQAGEQKELKLIVKADVQGSVEAVAGALLKLTGDKVKVTVIHQAVGAVSESDVMLASASEAIVIGFNVKPDGKAKRLAEQEGVDVRSYSIIYDAVDEVKKAMVGLLEPVRREQLTGKAEVREVFRISGKGAIAGSFVTEGKVQRNAQVRVRRGGATVHEGRIDGLKRFKEDVREVASGFECGISLAGFNELKQGDILEVFQIEEIAPTL